MTTAVMHINDNVYLKTSMKYIGLFKIQFAEISANKCSEPICKNYVGWKNPYWLVNYSTC